MHRKSVNDGSSLRTIGSVFAADMHRRAGQKNGARLNAAHVERTWATVAQQGAVGVVRRATGRTAPSVFFMIPEHADGERPTHMGTAPTEAAEPTRCIIGCRLAFTVGMLRDTAKKIT